MIEARIFKNDTEIARVRISKVQTNANRTADYSVNFGVERGGAVGIHNRALRYFPRLRYNVLALLLQALSTLDPKELELESDADLNDTHSLDPRELDWH